MASAGVVAETVSVVLVKAQAAVIKNEQVATVTKKTTASLRWDIGWVWWHSVFMAIHIRKG